MDDLPALMHDERIVRRDVQFAHVGSARLVPFAAGQTLGLFVIVGPLSLTAGAGLLPRVAPLVACALWMLSLMRFLV